MWPLHISYGSAIKGISFFNVILSVIIENGNILLPLQFCFNYKLLKRGIMSYQRNRTDASSIELACSPWDWEFMGSNPGQMSVVNNCQLPC